MWTVGSVGRERDRQSSFFSSIIHTHAVHTNKGHTNKPKSYLASSLASLSVKRSDPGELAATICTPSALQTQELSVSARTAKTLDAEDLTCEACPSLSPFRKPQNPHTREKIHTRQKAQTRDRHHATRYHERRIHTVAHQPGTRARHVRSFDCRLMPRDDRGTGPKRTQLRSRPTTNTHAGACISCAPHH